MIRVVNVRGLRTPEQRKVVCYVGRRFAGWPGHPLANPFKPKSFGAGGACQNVQQAWHDAEIRRVLAEYTAYLPTRENLEAELAQLWEDCKQGALPLGCWCIDTEVRPHEGSGPLVCHAQILAHELLKRFGAELCCCICHRPATSHYTDRLDAPSCGRVECEVRMQAAMDAHEGRG